MPLAAPATPNTATAQTYRWELGPTITSAARAARSVPSAASVDDTVPSAPDVQSLLKAYDTASESVTMTIPSFITAAVTPLAKIRVYAVPVGTPLPADGPGWAASDLPYTEEDTSSPAYNGVDVSIPLPPIPDSVDPSVTLFFVQVLHGYAQ